MYQFSVLIIAAILFSGCSILSRQDYVKPDISVPENWQAETAVNSGGTRAGKFWESFEDPLLNRLIERVLKANNDVCAAAIKVRRARLEAKLARTDLYPTPSVSSESSFSKDLKSGDSSESFGVTAGLSYEIDLWNKFSDMHDAAVLEAEATEADRQSAILSLIGTTAELYWQIGYLNQSISLNRNSIAYAERTFALVQARYDAGHSSRLELINSQRNLLSKQTSLTQDLQSLAEARHALAILFDQAPDQQVEEPTGLEETYLPSISAGVPADVLHNRPDLCAAELRLKKNHKQIGITKAEYYPSISLTGNLGSSSMHLREILENPVASLGIGLALPFIKWNETKLNVQIAETEYAEAVVNFRQTLYTALSEVENALSARIHFLNERKLLQESFRLAIQGERLSEVRYRMGETDLQEWLDEQEQRREAKRSLNENRLNQLKNTMQLSLALGGGLADKSGEFVMTSQQRIKKVLQN